MSYPLIPIMADLGEGLSLNEMSRTGFWSGGSPRGMQSADIVPMPTTRGGAEIAEAGPSSGEAPQKLTLVTIM